MHLWLTIASVYAQTKEDFRTPIGDYVSDFSGKDNLFVGWIVAIREISQPKSVFTILPHVRNIKMTAH